MLSAAFLNFIMRLTVLGWEGSEQQTQKYQTQTLWNTQCFTAHTATSLQWQTKVCNLNQLPWASWMSCFFRFLLAHKKCAGCIARCQSSRALMIPSPAEYLWRPAPHQSYAQRSIAVNNGWSASTIIYQKISQLLSAQNFWLGAEATPGEQPAALQIKGDEEFLVNLY